MKAVDVFESVASLTWQRICLGEKYKISQGEETITDLNLLEIARANCPEVQVIKTPKNREKDQGTDWEWWIGNSRLGWLRYAVQAKKINPNTSRYAVLGHEVDQYQYDNLMRKVKVGKAKQIDILERYATVNRSIPLYCFYNHLANTNLANYWHCNLSYEVNQFGCTVTPSKNVHTALAQRGARKFSFLHNFNETKPWRCLVRCPLMLQVYQSGSSSNSSLGFANVFVYRSLPSELSAALETGSLEGFSSNFYSQDLGVYPKRILVANYVGENS